MGILSKNIRLGVISVCLLFLADSMIAEDKLMTEIFQYELSDLKAVQDTLKQVVGPEGKTVFLYDKRKVLVQDKASRFDMIQAVMQEFNPKKVSSVAGPMVKVELFFNEDNTDGQTGVSVEGQVQSGPVTIGTGTPGSDHKIRINAIDRRTTTSSNQTAFLMVQSGMYSRLNVSKEVPRPAYFYSVLSRYGYVQTGVAFERVSVGTMLEVAPTVRGNWIDLDITPVITSMENNRRRDFKVRELTTRVTLASGSKVQIGGFQGAQEDFNRRFFGVNRRDGIAEGGFAVRATVQEFGR
ncbi:MAG: hypothetical protein AAF649_09500 [Verrucomicrobiota bacterium]